MADNHFIYAVATYIPDIVRDERVNIGVLVISKSFGASRFEIGDFHRVLALDPDVDLCWLRDQHEIWKTELQRYVDKYDPALPRNLRSHLIYPPK